MMAALAEAEEAGYRRGLERAAELVRAEDADRAEPLLAQYVLDRILAERDRAKEPRLLDEVEWLRLKQERDAARVTLAKAMEALGHCRPLWLTGVGMDLSHEVSCGWCNASAADVPHVKHRERCPANQAKAALADPTGVAALEEWRAMRAVVEAADRFARMAPPWGHVDRFKRLDEMRDALAAIDALRKERL